MKSAVFVAAFVGSLAMATPFKEEKRYMVTEVVMETATVTVVGNHGWGGWGWGRSSSPTASNSVSVVGSTTAPASTSSSVTTTPSTTPEANPTMSSSTSSASQPTTSGSSSGSISAYADPILKQHNLHRDNHTSPPLTWDTNLANIAAEIASSCQYAHNTKAGGGGYGQNIGAGAPDTEIDKMITDQMYNDEMMFYPGYGSEPDMSNFEQWGHFSQIVWKETTKIGCYTQHCTNGLGGVGSNVSPYFTVCNYQPVGNFAGQYAANVLAPKGDPIVIV